MPVALEKWGTETVIRAPSAPDSASSSALAPLRGVGFVAAYAEGAQFSKIQVRLVDPLGNPSVNFTNAFNGRVSDADIAALANGSFVVSATQFISLTGPSHAVYSGGTLHDPSSTGSSAALSPYALGDDSDRFLAVWRGRDVSGNFGVWGRLFLNNGTPVAPEFAIKTSAGGGHTEPDVAAVSGGAVVVWTESVNSGDIRFRIFADTGPVVPETTANAFTSGVQQNPAVTMLSDGRFVIVWEDNSNAFDADGQGITARIFNRDGTPATASFAVNATTAGNQIRPHVTALQDGGFMVAFSDPANGWDVFVRAFDAAGNAVSGDFRVNTTVAGQQISDDIITLEDGRVAVSFTDATLNRVMHQILDTRVGDFFVGDGDDNVIVGRQTGQSDPDDNISGLGGNDKLFGVGGADFLDGGGGNDGLDGGPGIDRALFSGPRSAYTIELFDGGGRVIGPDGNDTVTNVERLVFADVAVPIPPGDFGGDFHSDILIEHSGGALGLWQMDGPSIRAANDLPTLPAGWHVAGSGDFGGDARNDVLLRNDSGNLGLWQMSGPNILSAHDLPSLPPGWHVVGDGDVGGDGKSDLLLQSESGGVGLWQMNGGQVASAHDLPSLPAGWHVASVGDINGDTFSDVLLSNDTGGLGLWAMTGASIQFARDLPTLPAGWSVEDVGDFDANGCGDILLHHEASGRLGLWLMFNTNVLSAHDLPTLPAGWDVDAVGDFNADGRSDILLHNDGGAVGLWEMNGPNIVAAHDIVTTSPAWSIVGYQYDLV